LLVAQVITKGGNLFIALRHCGSDYGTFKNAHLFNLYNNEPKKIMFTHLQIL